MATNKEIIHVGLKGARKTQSGLKGIGRTALKMGAVFFAAKGVITGMKTIVESGSKLKNTEMAFKNMGASVGFTDQAMNKFKEATNGTVTELELMTKANNAMALGIVESEDQFATMLDTAQRLGAALGQDVVQSLDSLVTGMGRQSKLMLDNLGIMVDTDKAYADYAEELGKTTSQLTEQEKKIAFNQATMKEANRIVETMGDEQETTAMKVSKLKTTFMDMAARVGEDADGMFSSVVDAAQGVADKVSVAMDFITRIDFAGTFNKMKENWQKIGGMMVKIWQLVVDVFPDLFMKVVDKLWPILRDAGIGLWEGIKFLGKFIFEPLVIAFKMGINKIKGDWAVITQWLGDKFEIAGAKISNGFTIIIDGVKKGLNMLIDVTNKLTGTEIKPFEMGEMVDVEKMKEDMATSMDETRKVYDDKSAELREQMMATEMADFVKGFFMPDEDDIDTLSDFNAGFMEIMGEFTDQFIELEDKKQGSINKTTKATEDSNKVTVKSASELTKQRQSATQTLIGDLQLLGGESKKWKNAYKMVEGSKALVDTYRSAGAQFKAYSETYKAPFGMIAGVAAAAVAVSAGLMRVKQIKEARVGADFITTQPTLMMVGESGRESVQVTPLEGENYEGNQGTGGQNINISLEGNVMTDDFVESQLIEKIREGLRLGGSIS